MEKYLDPNAVEFKKLSVYFERKYGKNFFPDIFTRKIKIEESDEESWSKYRDLGRYFSMCMKEGV